MRLWAGEGGKEIAHALFVFEDGGNAATARERIATWRQGSALHSLIDALPVYACDELPQMIARLEEVHQKIYE